MTMVAGRNRLAAVLVAATVVLSSCGSTSGTSSGQGDGSDSSAQLGTPTGGPGHGISELSSLSCSLDGACMAIGSTKNSQGQEMARP